MIASINLFTQELGKSIVDKLNENGWNVYTNHSQPKYDVEGRRKSVRLGPTSTINQGVVYVPIRECDDPANPESVFAAIKKYNEPPCITFPTQVQLGYMILSERTEMVWPANEPIPFIGFCPGEFAIEVDTNYGITLLIPNNLFYNSLEFLSSIEK